MKLRLQITTPAGSSTPFESPGPLVRIGRDPICELLFRGEAGKAISPRHAQVRLTPEGAILTDTGSSSGTLWNDRPVKGPRSLRIGDRIQLGNSGPILTVLTIELPEQSGTKSSSLIRRLIQAGTAVVALALVLLVGFVWHKYARNQPSASGGDEQPDEVNPRTQRRASIQFDSKHPLSKNRKPAAPGLGPISPGHEAREADPQVPAPEPQKPFDAPLIESRPIGRYVSLPQWGPSVLLQRRGDAYPWTLLRPEGKIQTAQTLVVLPGYRSRIFLGRENRADGSWSETGVQLGLWGNLPELSRFPPVLESVVMLKDPAPGIDLDIILDRGRIHIANRKAGEAVKARLRFLHETWDVTLSGVESEICAELWSLPPQTAATSGRVPIPCLGLFTRGRVLVSARQQQLDLAGPSRVSWVSSEPGSLVCDPLPQLPDWWAKPPDAGSPQTADAQVCLLDWQKTLLGAQAITDRILTELRGPKDPKDTTYRKIGLLFLSALNGQQSLVEFLDTPYSSEVRGTTAYLLRSWLSQNPNHPTELARMLQEIRGYSKGKAQLVVELLQPISAQEQARPETYQRLINLLNHEGLPVRDLAFWHLALLAGPEKGTIDYNPAGRSDERKKGMDQWRKLIPPGKVPGK